MTDNKDCLERYGVMTGLWLAVFAVCALGALAMLAIEAIKDLLK